MGGFYLLMVFTSFYINGTGQVGCMYSLWDTVPELEPLLFIEGGVLLGVKILSANSPTLFCISDL